MHFAMSDKLTRLFFQNFAGVNNHVDEHLRRVYTCYYFQSVFQTRILGDVISICLVSHNVQRLGKRSTSCQETRERIFLLSECLVIDDFAASVATGFRASCPRDNQEDDDNDGPLAAFSAFTAAVCAYAAVECCGQRLLAQHNTTQHITTRCPANEWTIEWMNQRVTLSLCRGHMRPCLPIKSF